MLPFFIFTSLLLEVSGTSVVISNAPECASIGRSILERNGSAADAAISVVFCEDVVYFADNGIAGDFVANIFSSVTGEIECLDARTTAPLASNATMFEGRVEPTHQGGLSVGVPSQLKGLWELYRKYGKLPWRDLVQPAVALAQYGFLVTPYMAVCLDEFEENVRNEPSLASIFVNPETNRVWKAGDHIKHPQLADSFKLIAERGGNILYSRNSSLLNDLLEDLREFGSILVEEDFIKYRSKWRKPVSCFVKGLGKLYTVGLPGGGPILCFLLNIVQGLELDDSAASWHRVIEAFKFANAKRSILGDPAFVPGMKKIVEELLDPEFAAETRAKINPNFTFSQSSTYGAEFGIIGDHGTSNVVVLSPSGDVIVLTTTLNQVLGAQIRSERTGIVLNSMMDDFSVPGAPNFFGLSPAASNFIAPGKRPISSMSPSIVLNRNGRVKMAIGSAGGSKIPNLVAQTLIHYLRLNRTLLEAVREKRLHHQLFPNYIEYEEGTDSELLDQLQSYGHLIKETNRYYVGAVTGFVEKNGEIEATYDARRSGSVEVF